MYSTFSRAMDLLRQCSRHVISKVPSNIDGNLPYLTCDVLTTDIQDDGSIVTIVHITRSGEVYIFVSTANRDHEDDKLVVRNLLRNCTSKRVNVYYKLVRGDGERDILLKWKAFAKTQSTPVYIMTYFFNHMRSVLKRLIEHDIEPPYDMNGHGKNGPRWVQAYLGKDQIISETTNDPADTLKLMSTSGLVEALELWRLRMAIEKGHRVGHYTILVRY
jgi:hypothetical protein